VRILLAVDRSPYSEEAVRSIAGRPWPAGTTIRILHAIPSYPVLPPVVDFVEMEAEASTAAAQARQDAEALLASVAAQFRAAGLNAETVIAEGDARAAILDSAKAWSADLIVVGSHGYTGITRWLLGSVAQSVVAHAPCSVEVVRKKASEAS
jgi:nucleotide-binding universal stress UspA family protein